MVALVRTTVAGTAEEGNCGLFSRGFKFTLTWGTGPGVILQRIKRKYWVQLHQSQRYPGGQAPAPGADDFRAGHLKAAQIDAYATRADNAPYAVEKEYWEAWYIPPAGIEPVGDGGATVDVNDTLGSSRITNAPRATKYTSRGTFIIEAHAFYYPVKPAEVANQRFTVICARLGLGQAALSAGVLPSALQDPRAAHATDWAKVAVNSAAADAENICHMVAKWDSTIADQPRFYGETFVVYGAGPAPDWSANAPCAPFDRAALARAAVLNQGPALKKQKVGHP